MAYRTRTQKAKAARTYTGKVKARKRQEVNMARRSDRAKTKVQAAVRRQLRKRK